MPLPTDFNSMTLIIALGSWRSPFSYLFVYTLFPFLLSYFSHASFHSFIFTNSGEEGWVRIPHATPLVQATPSHSFIHAVSHLPFLSSLPWLIPGNHYSGQNSTCKITITGLCAYLPLQSFFVAISHLLHFAIYSFIYGPPLPIFYDIKIIKGWRCSLVLGLAICSIFHLFSERCNAFIYLRSSM